MRRVPSTRAAGDRPTRRQVTQWAMAAVTAPLWAAPTLARPGAAFERGVAIHNMMNWAAVEAADPGRYSLPPFVGPNYETPDALLRNLTKAGFDFVRLTID